MGDLERTNTDISSRQPRSRSEPVPLELDDDQHRLSRVYSAQHIDDYSHYHGHDERYGQQSEATSSEESDFSEKVEREEDSVARENAGEETAEVREGVVNERDVEAPLEKTQSSRSIRDPNLVRAVDFIN